MMKVTKEPGNLLEIYTREIDWRRALHKKYGVEFKANDELLNMADRMREKTPGKPISRVSRVTLDYLFAKSQDTYQSIQILCKTAFGREALILVRSLLESLITILYMFQDENKTEERITEWIQYYFRERKVLLDTIKTEPTDFFKVKERWLKKESEIRKTYEQLPEKIRKKKTWMDKGYEQLAKKVELEAQYIYYRHLSSLAHSTSRSSTGRGRVVKNRVEIKVGPSIETVPDAFVFSHGYFLMILKKVNFVLGLNEKPNLAIHERLYSVRRGRLKL